MKNCARCGAESLDDAGFCANCGSAFTPESEVQGTAAPLPAPFGTSPQAGVAPPPSPYGQPPAGYPPQAPLPGVPYAPVPYPMMAQITNSKATASLVLGIIGIFMCPIVCSVIAIILGSMAKSEIAASGGYQTGESNAKAGIILGWIGLALAAVSVMIVVIAIILAAASAAALPVSAILVLI